MAAAPVIKANDDEVSDAVGCITVCGLLALVTYPFASSWLFAGDPRLAGLFLGTAIHDTAQVVGSGMVYLQQFGTDQALDTATVTKLMRNLFMLAVIPLMATLYHRSARERRLTQPKLGQMVPLFVGGFVAMSLLRTVGDLGTQPFGLLSTETWERTIDATGTLAGWCLIAAMAAVGLGTSLARLKSLGPKPLFVGFLAALLVGGVSASLIAVLGRWMIAG